MKTNIALRITTLILAGSPLLANAAGNEIAPSQVLHCTFDHSYSWFQKRISESANGNIVLSDAIGKDAAHPTVLGLETPNYLKGGDSELFRAVVAAYEQDGQIKVYVQLSNDAVVRANQTFAATNPTIALSGRSTGGHDLQVTCLPHE